MGSCRGQQSGYLAGCPKNMKQADCPSGLLVGVLPRKGLGLIGHRVGEKVHP